jgi:hypothetical protein
MLQIKLKLLDECIHGLGGPLHENFTQEEFSSLNSYRQTVLFQQRSLG